jgi:hypothetical protein
MSDNDLTPKLRLPVPPFRITPEPTATELSRAAHYAMYVTPVRNRLARLLRQRAGLVPYIEVYPGAVEDVCMAIEEAKTQLRDLVEFCDHRFRFVEEDALTGVEYMICIACGSVRSPHAASDDVVQGIVGPGALMPPIVHRENEPSRKFRPPQVKRRNRDFTKLRRKVAEAQIQGAKARRHEADARRAQARNEIKDCSAQERDSRTDERLGLLEQTKEVKRIRKRVYDRDLVRKKRAELKKRTEMEFDRRADEAERIARLRWDAKDLPVASLVRQLDLTKINEIALKEMILGISLELKRRERRSGQIGTQFRFGGTNELHAHAKKMIRAWEKFTGRTWEPAKDDYKGRKKDKGPGERDVRRLVVHELELQKEVPHGSATLIREHPGYFRPGDYRDAEDSDFTDPVIRDRFRAVWEPLPSRRDGRADGGGGGGGDAGGGGEGEVPVPGGDAKGVSELGGGEAIRV